MSQRAGDFDAEACRLTNRQTFWMSLQEPPEVVAVEQFRGDEHPAVGLIDVVDDEDTWMTQPSGRLGFPTKPSCVIWIWIYITQNLDRDVPGEAKVTTAPDLAHGSASR